MDRDTERYVGQVASLKRLMREQPTLYAREDYVEWMRNLNPGLCSDTRCPNYHKPVSGCEEAWAELELNHIGGCFADEDEA